MGVQAFTPFLAYGASDVGVANAVVFCARSGSLRSRGGIPILRTPVVPTTFFLAAAFPRGLVPTVAATIRGSADGVVGFSGLGDPVYIFIFIVAVCCYFSLLTSRGFRILVYCDWILCWPSFVRYYEV